MEYNKGSDCKKNPRETANLLSRISFLFTAGLLWKTFKTNRLEEDDLYGVLSSHKAQKLGEELEKHLKADVRKHGNISVYRILWSAYGNEYVFLGIVQLFMRTVIVITIPKALSSLVLYFQPHQTDLSKADAYVLALVLISLNLINVIYLQNYLLSLSVLGIKIRTAFCSLMYRKCLLLPESSASVTARGRIVTMITKDVGAFESIVFYANDVWIGFVQAGVVCYLIYQKIGYSAFVGMGCFLLMIPFQVLIGRLTTKYRLQSNKKTDERLQRTQETLYAIKFVKMNAWEKFFEHKILTSRKEEVKTIVKIFLTKVSMLLIGSLTSKIAFYLLIMAYIWFGNSISAGLAYFIATLFQRIRHAINVVIPKGITEAAELRAAVSRIETLLGAEHIQTSDSFESSIRTAQDKPIVNLNEVTIEVQNREILRNVNLILDKGLTVIGGPVGTGKTLLLKVFMENHHPKTGTVSTNGTISYAVQEPWIFQSTLKQNIVFGQEFDEKRYEETLRVCALDFDLKTTQRGDHTLVGDKGANLSKGQKARVSLARAVYKNSDIYLLDDCLSSLDPHVQEFIFEECIKKFLRDKLCVFVTHQARFLKRGDNAFVLDEGTLKVADDDLDYSEDVLDLEETSREEQNADEINDDEAAGDNEITELLTDTGKEQTTKNMYQEAKESGRVHWNVYGMYVRFGGGYLVCFSVVIFFVVTHISKSYTDKLVSDWMNLEQDILEASQQNSSAKLYEELLRSRNVIVFYYSVITLTSIGLSILTACMLFNFARKASNELHDAMVENVMGAASKFFDINLLANIINRFSKDFLIIDEQLPFIIYDSFEILFALCGIAVLIGSVHLVFIVPMVVLFGLLYIVRMLYMPAGRNLQRLDVATRAPIIGHLNASLDGLTTIRAFDAQNILTQEFSRCQDLCTSASYTSVCCNRAFALFLDVVCTGFVAMVIARFLWHYGDTAVGDVGLAITQAFMLSGLVQYGIRQWADMENKMTSVERVLEYTTVEREETNGGRVLNDWPKEGRVVFKEVTLLYENTRENVLKNISFEVRGREKIGIVGRTGAGKSSIISTLFRLYDYDGEITVDGVDIRTINLEHLRRSISVIQQDPLLFSGTIRENVDPLGLYKDEEIWRALEKVALIHAISSLENQVSNFSVGQKQLLCLARAFIAKSKIVILDEASGSVDAETESGIVRTIERAFSESTVLIIAHRLQSVLNCQRVMVVDQGTIVEYEDPRVLMADKSSRFCKMAHLSGLK